METTEAPFSLVVIDDEEVIRRGIVQFVDWKSLGFKIRASFEDGESALAYLKGTQVDAVLTDIRMLEVSGLDLAEYLARESPATKVVIMSGYRDFDYAVKALRCDVFEYLLKPVELDTLRETFEKLHAAICSDKLLSKVKEALPLDEEGFLQALLKEKPQDDAQFKALVARFHGAEEARAGASMSAAASAPAACADNADSAEGELTGYAEVIVRKAEAFMAEQFHRDLSLEEVANHVYLSPVYFSRFFKEKTGTNFIDRLTELRMKAAVELLDQHRYQIQEIGEMVGYRNAKYFTRVFKQLLGTTPTDYARRS
jgi:two-component system response regulator YesN